jgi:hypothetical protein
MPGETWDLQWIYKEQPFLPRGPAGSFYKDCIFVASQFLTVGGNHLFYFSGRPERHDAQPQISAPSSIGLMRLPANQFAYVSATATTSLGTAQLTTMLLKVDGYWLTITVGDMAPNASIAVSVLDESDATIDGFEASHSMLRAADDPSERTVEWHSRQGCTALGTLHGRSMRLRFELYGTARLYAFRLQVRRAVLSSLLSQRTRRLR